MITYYEKEGELIKKQNTANYKYLFNTVTGQHIRWGKTLNDDPFYSELGPEILDIEVSEICHGITDPVTKKSKPCSWCYKTNTTKGTNMGYQTFKRILDTMPENLTQIAFGIGDIDSNAYLWKMMGYTRHKGYIPNITINGFRMTETYYNRLAKYCGVVCVSLYDKENTYNVVHKLINNDLTDKTLKQVNIHVLLAEETLDLCMEVLQDKLTDPRLKDLYAITFLWLKPKGKRNKYHQVTSINKLKKLFDFAFDNNIVFGLDSCSAKNFLTLIKDRPEYEQLKMFVEPCESTLFSYYINAKGFGYPCSFTEDEEQYKGINMLKVNDFLKDVWYNNETVAFRQLLQDREQKNGIRSCPAFNLELEVD